MNRPSSKYDHGYAIVRLDTDAHTGQIPRDCLIYVKSVVLTKEEAEEEVARLNAINADKGCQYFYQITRIPRRDERENDSTGPGQGRK